MNITTKYTILKWTNIFLPAIAPLLVWTLIDSPTHEELLELVFLQVSLSAMLILIMSRVYTVMCKKWNYWG